MWPGEEPQVGKRFEMNDHVAEIVGIWGERDEACRHALGRGSLAFWEARLAQVARLERMGKGRLAGDPWRELARLVAAVSDPRVARALQ